MSQLDMLVATRKYVRKSVTDLHKAKDTYATKNAVEIIAVKGKLLDKLGKLKTIDEQVLELIWKQEGDGQEFQVELSQCDSYNDKINEALSVIENILNPVKTNGTHPGSGSPPAKLKRPTAPLPRYGSGKDENLTKFFLHFEQVVNKYGYSEYEKLCLLKGQISGRALYLIDSLESDKQGYQEAKALLERALASNEVQICNTLKLLSGLKLDKCSDPFQYISEIKSIQENVKKLQIDVNSILRHFVWEGLNEPFKKILISILNKSWPSLPEIVDNYFTACERYSHKPSKPAVSTGLAANVNVNANATGTKPKPRFYPCSLCRAEGVDIDHAMTNCPKYETPQLKLNRLREIKACIRCGSNNHQKNACTFRFKNACFVCKRFHWYYLCDKDVKEKPKNNSKTEKKSDKEGKKYNTKSDQNISKQSETNTGSGSTGLSVTILANQSRDDSKTVLPTFTLEIENHTMRVVKDGGCQTNFISDEMANQLKLKTLEENVELTVKGINVEKKYKTRMVEFLVKINDNTYKLDAICMPGIKIDLHLPGIRVLAKAFHEKGYTLADKLLGSSDSIKNIHFILGSKSSYILPETENVFGTNRNAVFGSTCLGVVLKGDIDVLLENVASLPFKASHSEAALVATHSTPTPKPDFLKLYENDVTTSNDGNFEREAFPAIERNDGVDEWLLQRAVRNVLAGSFSPENDSGGNQDESNEVFDNLVKYALENTSRNDEGRLLMPLLWNSRVSPFLGQNMNLSKCILRNLKSKGKVDLNQIDRVFKEQLELGIIEKIDNVHKFVQEHPECSFLPFMPVIRHDKETTKCRVVFLSNLCEKVKDRTALSHNQVMHAGPSLNFKLSTAILHLRFGSRLCCFDIQKAFNQIELNEVDRTKLCFLWFRNVEKEDYEIVAYRNARLPFGLRCSPLILMLGLYFILVESASENDEIARFKGLMYQLSYMDNCAISADSFDDLEAMYNSLPSIFDPYKFPLQQFVTNDDCLQKRIDEEQGTDTPPVVKLLGLQWDRANDTLFTRKISLDSEAGTKRMVLSTIATQFDLMNFNGPLMNRARLFMNKLQCDRDLEWDSPLPSATQKEWVNIAKQANAAPPIQIDRNVGSRSDRYKLIVFADSSRSFYGIVCYLLNVNENKLYFVTSKNKIVSKNLESKSIPSLELLAIVFAVETICELKNELTGERCMYPLQIDECLVFSDSFVALTWVQSFALKLDKMQKRSAFVLNRLEKIIKLCEVTPIKFNFVSGEENPADSITRTVSYKLLVNSNFLTGPKFLKDGEMPSSDCISFILPGFPQKPNHGKLHSLCGVSSLPACGERHLISLDRVSSFMRAARIHAMVLQWVNKLKSRLKTRDPLKFGKLVVKSKDHNYIEEASITLIKRDQMIHFKEVFEYFESKIKTIKAMPSIIHQLNLYLDSDGVLRVKSKFERMKDVKKLSRYRFPALISKSSKLTELVIQDYHISMSHAGTYSILAEMRKKFWVPHAYSVVKKNISNCVICKRLNGVPLKLNQSPYREFMLDTSNVPYNHVFIDYLGPFMVKLDQNVKVKVWLLCITCTWSRAINLKVCVNAGTQEFLRAFQLHCFQHGIPSNCVSDLGTNIVAGTNLITGFLNDVDTQTYLNENGIKSVNFDQYYKGKSELGALVETCVKLTKKLVFGAIQNNIGPLRDFEFLVEKTIHLVNRRPIAFKESLRDTSTPVEIITPEMLINGRELVSMNVMPEYHGDISSDPNDPDWKPGVIDKSFSKLLKIRNKLVSLYNDEYVGKLIYQAVNVPDRYKPVKHALLKIGDIVMIKEPNMKRFNFPLGRVQSIVKNVNGETTGAEIVKAKTGEVVKRHSSTLIPLLSCKDDPVASKDADQPIPSKRRSKRLAAQRSSDKTKAMLNDYS